MRIIGDSPKTPDAKINIEMKRKEHREREEDKFNGLTEYFTWMWINLFAFISKTAAAVRLLQQSTHISDNFVFQSTLIFPFFTSSHSYHTIREIERARLWAEHGSEMWIGLDHCATLKWNNFYISRFHLSLFLGHRATFKHVSSS